MSTDSGISALRLSHVRCRPLVLPQTVRVAILRVLTVATAAVVLSACGAAHQSTTATEPLSPETPPHAATASGKPIQLSAVRQDVGPGLNPDQATQLVLSGMGDPSVTSAVVGAAPADSGGSGQWLTGAIESDQADGIKQDWLAQLMQGAVADLMRTDEATTSQVLDGAQLVDRDASGRQVVTPIGHGGVVGGQVFDSPIDDALRQRIEDETDRLSTLPWRLLGEEHSLRFATDFEPLAVACAELGRWEFQFVVAPLVIPRATGSPVNPLAIL